MFQIWVGLPERVLYRLCLYPVPFSFPTSHVFSYGGLEIAPETRAWLQRETGLKDGELVFVALSISPGVLNLTLSFSLGY